MRISSSSTDTAVSSALSDDLHEFFTGNDCAVMELWRQFCSGVHCVVQFVASEHAVWTCLAPVLGIQKRDTTISAACRR